MTFLVSSILAHGRKAGGLAAAAAISIMLAGCYTTHETADVGPADYRQRHPITLQEGRQTVEVFVGTSHGGLTPAQRADVLAFARRWQRDATGGVVIDVPAGTPNERAAAESLHEIQSILVAAGLPSQGIAVRPYRPAERSRLATIRLNYPRITAQAGPCGLWPHDLGPADTEVYEQNRQYWNFGCASQRNLAAMVDDPADLVQPRGEIPAYQARRSVVLDKYRHGQGTATSYSNANQGKISNIGQ